MVHCFATLKRMIYSLWGVIMKLKRQRRFKSRLNLCRNRSFKKLLLTLSNSGPNPIAHRSYTILLHLSCNPIYLLKRSRNVNTNQSMTFKNSNTNRNSDSNSNQPESPKIVENGHSRNRENESFNQRSKRQRNKSNEFYQRMTLFKTVRGKVHRLISSRC